MKTNNLISVGSIRIPWSVTAEGMFRANMAGEYYEAETLKKLTDMLRVTAKKTPLNIPFVQVFGRWQEDDWEIKKGVVTGRHSGNRNLLVRFENGESEQLSEHSGILHGEVDIVELKRLFDVKKAACEMYEQFLEENRLEVPR